MFVENFSTNPIVVDRYALSKTWYGLLVKLGGKHPDVIDKAMMNVAYSKIVERMKQMTDEELLDDVNDIVGSIEYIRMNILPKSKGYFKK